MIAGQTGEKQFYTRHASPFFLCITPKKQTADFAHHRIRDNGCSGSVYIQIVHFVRPPLHLQCEALCCPTFRFTRRARVSNELLNYWSHRLPYTFLSCRWIARSAVKAIVMQSPCLGVVVWHPPLQFIVYNLFSHKNRQNECDDDNCRYDPIEPKRLIQL